MRKREKKKDSSQRSMDIFSLVLTVGAWGFHGYALFRMPAYHKALADQEVIGERHRALETKRQKRDGARTEEQETVLEALVDARTATEEAMFGVMGSTTGTLAFAFFGVAFAFISLKKTKWQRGKITKRLGQRVFAFLTLAVGLGALYVGGVIFYQFS